MELKTLGEYLEEQLRDCEESTRQSILDNMGFWAELDLPKYVSPITSADGMAGKLKGNDWVKDVLAEKFNFSQGIWRKTSWKVPSKEVLSKINAIMETEHALKDLDVKNPDVGKPDYDDKNKIYYNNLAKQTRLESQKVSRLTDLDDMLKKRPTTIEKELAGRKKNIIKKGLDRPLLGIVAILAIEKICGDFIKNNSRRSSCSINNGIAVHINDIYTYYSDKGLFSQDETK